MKKELDVQKYLTFFKEEMKENLLFFWMSRCLDEKNGGYLNCFSNDGSKLVSTDKYTWSQGRFLWMFSRLATIESDMFTEEDRKTFLAYEGLNDRVEICWNDISLQDITQEAQAELYKAQAEKARKEG